MFIYSIMASMDDHSRRPIRMEIAYYSSTAACAAANEH